MNSPDQPNGDGTLSWVVHEDDGTVLDEGSQPIDSYVLQWVQILSALMGDQTVSGVTDTSNIDQTIDNGDNNDTPMLVDAASGTTDHGIKIGNGSATETITDFELDSPLTANISYGTTSASSGTTSGSSATFDITRTFGNNTGKQLSITETGLIAEVDAGGAGTDNFLIIRDTGSPILTIADGTNATLQYRLEFTV